MHDDRGDVISAYLLRLVGALAVAGLLIIETAAITINRFGLEEAVQRAADRAATAYAEQRSAQGAEAAARQRLRRADVRTVDVGVDIDGITVTGTRRATVLVSDRLDALSHLVGPAVTARAPVDR